MFQRKLFFEFFFLFTSQGFGFSKPPSGIFSKKIISRTFFQKDRASTAYLISVMKTLQSFMTILEENFLLPLLSKAFLRQLLRFSVAKIFNKWASVAFLILPFHKAIVWKRHFFSSLLNRTKWCPCNVGNGLALKSALEKLEDWLYKVEEEFQGYLGQSGPPLVKELKILNEAVSFLVSENQLFNVAPEMSFLLLNSLVFRCWKTNLS